VSEIRGAGLDDLAWYTLCEVWGMAWFVSGMEAKANGAAFQPASDCQPD